MKRLILILTAIIVSFTTLTGCQTTANNKESSSAKVEASDKDQPRIIKQAVKSKALENSRSKEDLEQPIQVYLPPSYHTTKDRKYPVVYYLHGFGEQQGALIRQNPIFDEVMKAEGMKEFIVVEVNGKNKLGGSFYVNSPAIGNWEDHIVYEVVDFIDKNYRTVADRSGRGIIGFSMGGFGAVNLGFKHPERFSAVYAVAPGLFDAKGLEGGLKMWDSTFRKAYAAAFSPTKEGFPLGNEITYETMNKDPKVKAQWNSGFGDLEQKISEYKKKDQKLTAIHIKYGTREHYPWIKDGSSHLSTLLKQEGIEHGLEIFEGGHNLPYGFVRKDIVPFFSKHFSDGAK